MTASIVITHNAVPPVNGSFEGDVSFLATVFTLTNFSNTGVLAWRWTLIDQPIGSSAALSSTTASATQITPDVEGAYLVQLQTYLDAGATILDDQDTQLIDIAFSLPNNWQIPAAGETTQRGRRGWATPVEYQMRQVHARIGMVKHHLRSGDKVLVPADYEYLVKGPFTIEAGASLTLDGANARLSVI